MLRRLLVFASLSIFMISLTGCSTCRKKTDLEIQGLKNQISLLETQSQAKDEEINSLKDALSKQTQVVDVQDLSRKVETKKRIVGEVRSRPNIKHIQIALRNAGLNPGPIDGKMGRMTIEAVKAFQANHNLRADGKVGKATWRLLSEYLYKQLK